MGLNSDAGIPDQPITPNTNWQFDLSSMSLCSWVLGLAQPARLRKQTTPGVAMLLLGLPAYVHMTLFRIVVADGGWPYLASGL